ncbi:MAG: hypothetical protein PHE56_10560 [Bacteroidales bacterium]|nr:hypothetical protein [Bacteroidales bacterium]
MEIYILLEGFLSCFMLHLIVSRAVGGGKINVKGFDERNVAEEILGHASKQFEK